MDALSPFANEKQNNPAHRVKNVGSEVVSE